eukprot:TRINITY_DN1073_c1_g4_i1.p1 TRINITY_DN1073_c1_g4~~TRINITY_DN1073_c1_g4_i1.p1  ORF type:complete len:4122 (+),score=1331.11 TRINITY_DN1073_c1_g4_i1:86-12451(+)
MSGGPPFWRASPYVGLLADPYVSGTPLASGHVVYSMRDIGEGLGKVVEEGNHSTKSLLGLLGAKEMGAIGKIGKMFEECLEWSVELFKAEKPEQVLPFVGKVIEKINTLPIGDSTLCPAGWISLNNAGTLMYIITRDEPASYSLTICNGGAGIRYHPSTATADKIKYKTAVKISRIPRRRIADHAFWTFTFLLFTKDPPSEFSRVEVIYDVLLPWMAEVTTDHPEDDAPAAELTDIMSKFFTGGANPSPAPAAAPPSSSLGASLLAAIGQPSPAPAPAPKPELPPASKPMGGLGASLLAALETPTAAAPAKKPLRLLSEAWKETESDPHAPWRSRSKTSGHWKSAWECGRYLLSAEGLTEPMLKQLSLALRKEFLVKAATDLLKSIKAGHPLITELVDRHGAKYNPLQLGILSETLAKAGKTLITNEGDSLTAADILSRGVTVIGIYVSGSWCPPCKAFTPHLARLYETTLKPRGMEIVWVSADKSQAEFNAYLESMPWPAVPYEAGGAMAKLLGATGIPSLYLFDAADGTLITDNGVRAIMEHGKDFPWPDRSILRPRIGNDDARLLNIGTEQLARKALKEFNKERLTEGCLHNIHALCDAILRAADASREPDSAPVTVKSSETDLGINKVKLHGDHDPPPHVDLKGAVAVDKLQGWKHFADKDTKRFEGPKALTDVPAVTDMLSIPASVADADEALAALIKCEAVCDNLVVRANEASTTSRIVLHLQAIAAIGGLFNYVIPLPKPKADKSCIWSVGFKKGVEDQKKCLTTLHRLMIIYVTVWQSVERPTRGCDSERFLVVSAILAVFDKVVRQMYGDTDTLLISSLMAEDNGVYLSTKLCKDGRSYDIVAKALELEVPRYAVNLGVILKYFKSVQSENKIEIFDWRMPQKIELRKYGATCMFLRKFMERAGYCLIPEGVPNPPCEMEALVNWLTQDDTQLAAEHPQFGQMRDVSAMFRFAATMETRETELLRRRKDNTMHYWKLSFDDSLGRRGGAIWMSRRPGIHWDTAGIRGVDMDIADVTITGFGGRELFWGEGPVVQSPADIERILELKDVTEDDVVHCDKLPTYGETLSREESERLMSALTVRYLTIPLVLDFFSTMDRHTYLFNPGMQALLRSVLFEPGCWVEEDSNKSIPHVPLRQTALQKKEASVAAAMDATYKDFNEKLLGTPHGLLLNELKHSPQAVLQPLLSITKASLDDLSSCSVYSSNAHFMCYLLSLLLDIFSYTQFTMDTADPAQVAELEKYTGLLRTTLETSFLDMLKRWAQEAEHANDMSTSAVLHSFIAMISSHDATHQGVQAMIGSSAYIRNWHGFGLGRLRSDILSDSDEEMTAEQRLLRFLQAQGIDTQHMAKSSLEKYVSTTGRSRPLFLHIGREVIRVPTLLRTAAGTELDAQNAKLPPWDMPETKVFRTLHMHRARLAGFVKQLESDALDSLLNDAVRVALRNPEFTYKGWASTANDRYSAARAELHVDIQGCEVLWRNDALRPVPDSMTQFPDFETIFGREPLHCGVVKKYRHKHWVHIVGTEYDLAEWDEPGPQDLGAGFPAPVKKEGDEELAAKLQEEENAQNSMMPSIWNRPKKRRGEDEPYVKVEDGVLYGGVNYSRELDPYSKDPHPEPTEDWAVAIYRRVIQTLFPVEGGSPLKFKFYLPDVFAEEGAKMVTLIGCDGACDENLTWKEARIYKESEVMDVWMFSSHGRRLFKSLIFSSNARLSYHNLTPDPDKAYKLPLLRYAAGNLKQRRQQGPSLVITRLSKQLNGTETYVPPMLLQGLIPSSFLEAFNMWLGEDDIIRGEPIDAASSWFDYTFEVHIDTNAGTAAIHRRATSSGHTLINKNAGEGHLFRCETEDAEPKVVTSTVHVSDATVKAMLEIGLGHSEAVVRHALAKCDNSMDAAAQWLMDDSHVAEIAEVQEAEFAKQAQQEKPAVDEQGDTEMTEEPAEGEVLTKSLSSPTRNKKDDLAWLPLLVEEGFAEEAATHALQLYGGDCDIARQWLLDEDNAATIEEIVTGKKEAPSSDSSDLNLLPLCHVSQELTTNLAAHLAFIEDLSHVLAWVLPGHGSPERRISVIELPRLRLKLQPQKNIEGEWKLHLLDQPGWFLCFTPPDNVKPVLDSLPEYLLVQNRSNEFRVLIPNHDLVRPSIQGVAFPCRLVPLRTSLGWEEVMEQRMYSYPVHVSNSFLVSSGLGPTLYLLLVNLLSRNYEVAYRLADGVCTDTQLGADEQWIFDQLGKSMTDFHPDAAACRLQLSLAVMYSPVKCKWELHDEADWYFTVQHHVSACCTLNEDEIEAIVRRCAQGTPLIKNRLALINKEEAEVKPPAPVVPGQPWLKLFMASQTFIDTHCNRLQRVKFKAPPPLADKSFADWLWEDNLIQDDPSGGGKGLGVAFLYNAIDGGVPMTVGGVDISGTASELLTRWMHLKLARWGKEAIEEGEIEGVMSRHIVQLALKLRNKTRLWPKFPQGGRSDLQYGIDLYKGKGRDSPIRAFIDALDKEFTQCVSYHKQPGKTHEAVTQALEKLRKEPLSKNAVVRPAKQSKIRPKPSDTSCSSRTVQATHAAMLDFPLKPLVDEFILWVPNTGEGLYEALPFTVPSEATTTPVAKAMLTRLEADIKRYSNMQREKVDPQLRKLSDQDIDAMLSGCTTDGVKVLDALISKLSKMQVTDIQETAANIKALVEKVNSIPLPTRGGARDHSARVYHALTRLTRSSTVADLPYLASLFLSTKASDDLKAVNPYSPDVICDVIPILIQANRAAHASAVKAAAENLRMLILRAIPKDTEMPPPQYSGDFTRCKSSNAADETVNQQEIKIKHATKALADLLAQKRWYVDKDGSFDPRFLLFEFIFSIRLRKRQVEMVNWFAENLKNGVSRVQQMIMGQGKTQVVSPLLVLLLADGQKLVTQVMPSALLAQTRAVLQSCFMAPILPKKVFSLQFDRSVEDSPEGIVLLHSKLMTAAKDRGVVVAPPEAIKSLELKFIELLHSLESTDADMNLDVTDMKRKEAARMRDRMISRSDMADMLVDVLKLWNSGALLLDEVDVLLHPLRSELNFPIGNKHAIDLAGQRWDLPMFIIDTLFSASRGKLCVEHDAFWATAEAKAGLTLAQLVKETQEALHKGVICNALQTSPHLVLLDTDYYHDSLKTVFGKWAALWLTRYMLQAPAAPQIHAFITGKAETLDDGVKANDLKLLMLTREWMGALLPHVLSKIDRVGYGLLQEADMVLVDPNTTTSRLLTAVPFVGKDVPSRSSEFAHPDVVIGLTTLAYRYEGLRKNDLRAVIAQLKKEYSRQFGPRDRRPACVLYSKWIHIGAEMCGASAESVLPLPLFHLNDSKQFKRLYNLVRRVPELIYYYLDHHVYPATMNFQSLKISACGHELGSDLLFGRRAGFSGTPSNLMPIDLGCCEYEPGSDGDIIHTLTSPLVTSAELKINWSAKSLLQDIARADPPFHSLIDTGAYITNMDNNEVASYLLEYLPEWFEGVVFLDKQDKKMIMLRNGRVLALSQCGITEGRRFTFYDQIHTTGMDIKHAATARAVVTIGKDMTFRDYAQGAYRMRGIGKGQTIKLFIINEVQTRITAELGEHSTSRPELDVPCWLLLNSMRLENLQAMKLGEQELQNTWRKHALGGLVAEVEANRWDVSTVRLRRFEKSEWLKKCIAEYREVISHDICVENDTHQVKIDKLLEDHKEFTKTEEDARRVQSVIESIKGAAAGYDGRDLGFESEVVHEQEAEQEQEQEAEQEEQRESAFSRDDEQHNPWPCSALCSRMSESISEKAHTSGETPFYPASQFKATEVMPALPFPGELLVTDNFFRPTWLGLGERRLKVAYCVLKWKPTEEDSAGVAVVSLAEAETLRWMVHTRHPTTTGVVSISLSTVYGRLIAGSPATQPPSEDVLLCVRFLNGEMYYTNDQLKVLDEALKMAPLGNRREFFFEAVRLRRRQKGMFSDTPVAKLFTPVEEWHLIRTRGQVEYIGQALKHASVKGVDVKAAFSRYVEGGTVTPQHLRLLLTQLVPGVSPGDVQNVVNSFNLDKISYEAFLDVFSLPHDLAPTHKPAPDAAEQPKGYWQCRNCTFMNVPEAVQCEMCDYGWAGVRECPADKWICTPENGGCSYFNPKTLYYCEVCNRARPDLATVSF